MEPSLWKKFGKVLSSSANFEKKTTKILVLLDSKYTDTKTSFIDKIKIRLIELKGEFDGMIFKDDTVWISGNILRVSLVRSSKIIEEKIIRKLDLSNPLDIILIEMGELDALIDGLSVEDLDNS